ncbi:uncharacterized protein LOC108906342 isoform X1 [Anoplophora glabripennis]|uniref:uncharacterized protein LOC108906342 isoform X1 n=1 Tax=Anoplophora glabripennis TaxID=217634 RepID=UPI000C780ADB|nr:uncharacterized protein LOC108906342 isoform X1 [Anoplophora glabripennis]
MKPSMVNSSTTSVLVLVLVGIVLFVTTTNAAPHSPKFYYPAYYSPLSFDGQNPEYLLQAIARLREALINDNDLENVWKRSPSLNPGDDFPMWGKYYENQHEKQKKRKTDFGTDRGYSGQQEHNMRMNKYLLEYVG